MMMKSRELLCNGQKYFMASPVVSLTCAESFHGNQQYKKRDKSMLIWSEVKNLLIRIVS